MFDYSRLDGYLAPTRPHSARVRSLLFVGDPGAAWQRLIDEGTVPRAWGTDNRRSFLHQGPCRRCGGRGKVGRYDWDGDWEPDVYVCSGCRGRPVLPGVTDRPGDDHVRALGADPDGAARAEELARTVVAGFVPWGATAPERIVWRVGGELTSTARDRLPRGLPRSFVHVIEQAWADELADAPEVIWIALLGDGHPVQRPLVRNTAVLRAHWLAAAERGLRVPDSVQSSGSQRTDLTVHPAAGQSAADLPDQLTPLLELWTTGYALDEVKPDHLVLYAPTPR